MRRREFIAGLGSAAANWPFGARAQQPERMRRIGVLTQMAADDPESAVRLTAFVQGLQELGWSVGRNVQIDYRWGAGDENRLRQYAVELVRLAPAVILAAGGATLRPLRQANRTVPIVFDALDPVAAGFVESLAHPGGNSTGFTEFEYGQSGKWLELLKQIAPRVSRAVVLREIMQGAALAQFSAIQAVAPAFRVELTPVDVRDAGEIERRVAAFAREPNGGLIVTASSWSDLQRDLVITLASRNQLPAVYPFRYFVTGGGLISYGPDRVDQYRRAAGYVDRILRGEKPADLPVQAPTKYETVLNLKTAKALGITVPETLLATADEVIQ
jgi:putative tryptophan/tyrosine transport system substrate-binding protein